MKAAGSDPTHHEAIPRREVRIGQEASQYLCRYFYIHYQQYFCRREPINSIVSHLSLRKYCMRKNSFADFGIIAAERQRNRNNNQRLKGT